MPSQTHVRTRDRSLDFLRGLAVFLMILTHVNAVFYNKTGTLLDGVTWLGATVCFTMFLFVSGVIMGMSLDGGDAQKNQKAQKSEVGQKIQQNVPGTRHMPSNLSNKLGRTVNFIILYYVLALFVTWITDGLRISHDEIIAILSFQTMPEFTEFLTPFALYAVLFFIIRRWAGRWVIQGWVLLGISLVAYVFARVVSPIEESGAVLTAFKNLFTGNGQLHRFGVLAYAPVFNLALYWGFLRKTYGERTRKWELLGGIAGVTTIVLLVISGISTWHRWPPSPVFLLYGISLSLLVLWAYPYIVKLKMVREFLEKIGEKALHFYVFHIVMIEILWLLAAVNNGAGFENELIVLGISAFVIVLTALLTALSDMMTMRLSAISVKSNRPVVQKRG